MQGLTREEALLAKASILETCERLAAHGGGDRTNPVLPAIAGWVRDVILVLGEEQAPDLVRALASGFGLSLEESASLLTTSAPEAAEEPQTQDSDLVAIVGEHTLPGRYVQLLAETESPAIYHLASFLTATSAAIRRRARLNFDVFSLYPNLYTLLVGPTGARKDTAIDYACGVVQEACPSLHVLPVEGSPQGMAQALLERQCEMGTADGLVCAPEMKVCISKDKYKSAFAEWLTDWYKCQHKWSRGLRREKIELEDVYICALFGSTFRWLITMPDSALSGGFLPRIWIVDAGLRKEWKWRPRVDGRDRKRIVRDLAMCLAAPADVYSLTPEADAYMQRWYEHELASRAVGAGEAIRAYYERAHIITLKLAVVLHILTGGKGCVPKEACERAIALLAVTEAGTHRVLQNVLVSDDGQLLRDVTDTVRDRGGRATAREITKALQLRYAKRRIEDALRTLEYTGTVKSVLYRGQQAYLLLDPSNLL